MKTLGRRQFLAAGASAAALAAAGVRAADKARGPTRPNIVVIVVDDMRFDEYGAGGHPYLETPHIDALAAGGATFGNAYHTTPLCSPNRACILTGQYASRHGIVDNTSRSYASHRLHTFARELQRAGYETAHVGKWHMGNDPTPRPGYDYWVSFAGQGDITDPELFENGRLQRVPGYVTDLFTDRAIAFATRARTKPFMLYIGHKAVHPQIAQRDDGSVDVSTNQGFVPAQRHRGRYAGKIFKRRANFGFSAQERAGKPVLAATLDVKHLPETLRQFGPEELDEQVSDATIQARAEMMLAVDESLGGLGSSRRSATSDTRGPRLRADLRESRRDEGREQPASARADLGDEHRARRSRAGVAAAAGLLRDSRPCVARRLPEGGAGSSGTHRDIERALCGARAVLGSVAVRAAGRAAAAARVVR
jgi:hypothetical protein